MKKVQVNPLMPFTQVWWEVNGDETLFTKNSWVEVSESTWKDMSKHMKPISSNMQGQVFIAEDEREEGISVAWRPTIYEILKPCPVQAFKVIDDHTAHQLQVANHCGIAVRLQLRAAF